MHSLWKYDFIRGVKSIDTCPNCKNKVCVNSARTYFFQAIDLHTESNLFEIEMINGDFDDVVVGLNGYYPDKLKRPRRLPSKIPMKVPKELAFSPFILSEIINSGVVSITCNRTLWIFEYMDDVVEVECLDN